MIGFAFTCFQIIQQYTIIGILLSTIRALQLPQDPFPEMLFGLCHAKTQASVSQCLDMDFSGRDVVFSPRIVNLVLSQWRLGSSTKAEYIRKEGRTHLWASPSLISSRLLYRPRKPHILRPRRTDHECAGLATIRAEQSTERYNSPLSHCPEIEGSSLSANSEPSNPCLHQTSLRQHCRRMSPMVRIEIPQQASFP